MILKASQRSGGIALANHLMNDRDNDHVTLHSLRGFIADDLHGAMKEAHAVSKGTKCRQFLFSLSLNPPEKERLNEDQFDSALAKIEGKLGLSDHPRAVVFHEKEGRRHAHAVWSRVDARVMRAINLSHFKVKLKDVSRDLYLEHGWKMPRGLMKGGERDPFNFTLEEWQQAKRAKIDPKIIKRDLQDCWAVSDSGRAFAQALEGRGYCLAQGDRRGFVAVDWRGEVYSITRWTGKKIKEVRERLGDPASFPTVDKAQERLAERINDRLADLLKEQEKAQQLAEEEFAYKRRELVARQRQERAHLRDKQEKERAQALRARQARLPRGLKALWWRVIGKYAKALQEIEAEARAEQKRQAQERDKLVQHQLKERRELQFDRKEIRRANELFDSNVQIETARLNERHRKSLHNDNIRRKLKRQEFLRRD